MEDKLSVVLWIPERPSTGQRPAHAPAQAAFGRGAPTRLDAHRPGQRPVL